MKINAINQTIQNTYRQNNLNFNGKPTDRTKHDSTSFSYKHINKQRKGIIYNLKQKLMGKLAYDPIEQSKYYQKHGKIGKDVRIADGFLDPGKSGKIYDNGNATSNREIILVDRRYDNTLRDMTNYVMENTKGLNEKQKVTFLSSFLNNIDRNRKQNNVNTGSLPKRNTEVLLGDSIASNYAVGRHKALFFKIIGDEIGIKNDLIKGTVVGVKHAWNVVYYKDGKKAINDCTNGIVEDVNSNRVYHQAK